MLINSSRKKQVIDITEILNKELPDGGGLCNLFILHTTAALTTADLDPGTDLDMLDAFETMVPKLKYRHPHDPSHVGDHIISSLIGASLTLPFSKGELILGSWQRVVLIEFDGPRERQIVLNIIKSD